MPRSSASPRWAATSTSGSSASPSSRRSWRRASRSGASSWPAWSRSRSRRALSNFTRLKDAAAGLAGIAQQERGGLAALELARDRVDPGLGAERAELERRLPRPAGRRLLPLGGRRIRVAGLYARGARRGHRRWLGWQPTRSPARPCGSTWRPGTIAAAQRCLKVDASTGPTAPVPAGGLVIRPQGAGIQAGLRRYARASFPLSFGTLPSRAGPAPSNPVRPIHRPLGPPADRTRYGPRLPDRRRLSS